MIGVPVRRALARGWDLTRRRTYSRNIPGKKEPPEFIPPRALPEPAVLLDAPTSNSVSRIRFEYVSQSQGKHSRGLLVTV